MFVVKPPPTAPPPASGSNKSVPSASCTITQPFLFNRSNNVAGFPEESASPLERIQKLTVPVLELNAVLGGTVIWLGAFVLKLITPLRVTLPSLLEALHVAPLFNPSCSAPCGFESTTKLLPPAVKILPPVPADLVAEP